MIEIIGMVLVYGTLLLGFAGALGVLLSLGEHCGGRNLGPTSQRIRRIEYPEIPQRKEVEFIHLDVRIRRGSHHGRQTQR